jgi:hypothetical protein
MGIQLASQVDFFIIKQDQFIVDGYCGAGTGSSTAPLGSFVIEGGTFRVTDQLSGAGIGSVGPRVVNDVMIRVASSRSMESTPPASAPNTGHCRSTICGSWTFHIEAARRADIGIGMAEEESVAMKSILLDGELHDHRRGSLRADRTGGSLRGNRANW